MAISQKDIRTSNKIKASFFYSLRIKIILAFLSISIFLSIFLAISIYNIFNTNLFEQLRDRVRDLVQIGSVYIDANALHRLINKMSPGISDGEKEAIENSRDYQIIADQLNNVKNTEKKLLRFAYIFIPTVDTNKALYVVDALLSKSLPKEEQFPDQASHFGAAFEVGKFPVARKVLKEKISMAENEYSYDEEFNVNSVTGYAPVFLPGTKEFIAMIGLDIVDTDVRKAMKKVNFIAIVIISLALIVSITTSIFMGTIFTKSIMHLDEVVKQFGKSNFEARAKIITKDEVGRLSLNFNSMADTIQNYSARLESLLNAYGKFVPHEFIKLLNKDSITDIQLGDQIHKEMSILFSDMIAFTSLSETMTPKENFNFINSFLKRIGPEIRSHNGFIDKYIGDCIMALFPGAPDDAVQAGIGMRKRLVEYNIHRLKSGYQQIDFGTAVHTGDLMLGTIGESERMDGSVISDAVNLCSRLENLTRFYKVAILITESTLKKLVNPDKYQYRFVDEIIVRGKKEFVRIYEIFDPDMEEVRALKSRTKSQFEKAVQYFHAKKIKEAQELFTQIFKENPADKLSEIYIKRCMKAV